MWWLETSRLTRVLAALALAGLTAGCFQPMYGDSSVVANAGLDSRLAGVRGLTGSTSSSARRSCR
jgi:LPS-assembly lipoprotein